VPAVTEPHITYIEACALVDHLRATDPRRRGYGVHLDVMIPDYDNALARANQARDEAARRLVVSQCLLEIAAVNHHQKDQP
jgi:hypothetical protein